jgi:hypothetical protein
MKRLLLVAGGTVGGLGAVLAITPPQLTSTSDVSGLSGSSAGAGGTTAAPAAAVSHSAATPAATKTSATKSVATKKAVATESAQATTKASASASASASPTHSAASTPIAAPSTASTGYSGTVTGASFNARNYGTLAATVTFTNGQISHVSASQSPTSWSQNSLSALLPFVNGGKITVEQVKQYSAAQLPCATQNSCRSQASFTAEAFWSSIKSAISKAGL